MEVVAARELNTLYMLLDGAFLIFFALVLLRTKRLQALIAGLLGGLIYFIVDYGYFYLMLGTREVHGANPFFFLLWLSIGYGFTNFAWIWVVIYFPMA